MRIRKEETLEKTEAIEIRSAHTNSKLHVRQLLIS
jgi:hypothetical protein